MPTPKPTRDFTILLGVRVTKEIRRRMEALRRAQGTPIVYQVHLALEQWLAQQEGRRAAQ